MYSIPPTPVFVILLSLVFPSFSLVLLSSVTCGQLWSEILNGKFQKKKTPIPKFEIIHCPPTSPGHESFLCPGYSRYIHSPPTNIGISIVQLTLELHGSGWGSGSCPSGAALLRAYT